MSHGTKRLSDEQRPLWQAISQLPTRLFLIVGLDAAQAHLLGSLCVETRGNEDVIVLGGTETHVHVTWAAIERVERRERDGYDCLRFLGADHCLLEVVPESKDYRFPWQVLACLEGKANLVGTG